MEIKQYLAPAARYTTVAAASLAGAAAWDAVRLARLPVWPAVSYALLALAIVAGSAAVLARVLTRRPARARNTTELTVTGFVLLAWWLRGDPGIPADPPLVAAELLGAIALAAIARLDRARPRPDHARTRFDPRRPPRH